MDSKILVSCNIGDKCLESLPCKHDCRLKWSDDTEDKIRLGGWTLISNPYWNLLSKCDKNHFKYMINVFKRSADKKSNPIYSSFMDFNQILNTA